MNSRPAPLVLSPRAFAVVLALAALALTGRPVLAQAASEPGVSGVPVAGVHEGSQHSESRRSIDGALGLVVGYSPDYLGAKTMSPRVVPAFYYRWGPLAITSQSGFVTRGDEQQLERGLQATLVSRDRLRLGAALRYDPGRGADARGLPAGLREINSTLRARLGLQWRWRPDWRLGAGWSVDALGRGGGSVIEASAAHELPMPGNASLWLGAAATWADAQHLRQWHGITAEDARRTGLPKFAPGAGWRDVRLTAEWRKRLNAHWVLNVTGSLGHVLNGVADSPLVERRQSWGVASGLAWQS